MRMEAEAAHSKSLLDLEVQNMVKVPSPPTIYPSHITLVLSLSLSLSLFIDPSISLSFLISQSISSLGANGLAKVLFTITHILTHLSLI